MSRGAARGQTQNVIIFGTVVALTVVPATDPPAASFVQHGQYHGMKFRPVVVLLFFYGSSIKSGRESGVEEAKEMNELPY